MRRFVIACGGTGGHLAPGIALAEGLLARGHRVVLLISRKEVDSRLLKKYPDLEYRKIPGAGFSLRPLRFLFFLWGVWQGLWSTVRVLRQERPHLLIAFGGFISASAGFATMFMRVPLALHEANRRPGKANRLLARRADRLYLPRGLKLPGVSQKKMRYYGYPVRKEIRRLPREGARKQFGLDPHRKVLAILGGSQGAAALNQWAQDNLEALGSRGIQLLCLTGPRAGDEGLVEIPAGERVARACFLAFSDDMAAVLSSADLVISRAGAGSIAEIIRCRTPALLIPYPYASDNHQLANARYVEQQGGAVVVPQRNLTNLREEVLDLIFNDALLDKFRKNLARSDHENRMETLLMDLERLAGEGTRFTKLTSAQVS